MPVTVQSAQLEPPVHHGSHAGGAEAPQALGVGHAVARRDDRFGQVPPERLLARPAEGLFSLAVPPGDAAIHADRDDGVERRVHDQASPFLAGAQLSLEPCALEGQRRLVGERLRQLDLVGGELPDHGRTHLEHADDPALGAQRDHERRSAPAGRELAAKLVVEHETGVVEDVGAPHRPPLDHGASRQPHARELDVSRLELLGRDGHQGSVGSQQPERARVHVEQCQDGPDDLLTEGGRIKTVRQGPRQPRQLLGCAAPLLGLAVQRGVAKRQGCLRCEPLEQGQVLRFERRRRPITAAHGDHAEEDPAAEERLGDDVAHAHGDGRRIRARPRRIVRHQQPAPLLGADPRDPLADRNPRERLRPVGPTVS